MLQEPPELVAMRLALGQQLAALREAAGIIQPQIARRTGYSRSSVTHAEAGRQLLSREFWRTADELLHAEGALLASYEQVRKAKEAHEVRSREAELAKAYAKAQACVQELLASLVAAVGAELAGGLAGPLLYLAFLSTSAQAVPIEWRDQLHEQLRTFLREWANTLERRKLLRLFGWMATTVAASPVSPVSQVSSLGSLSSLGLDPDEQERLVKAIAVPSRVDDQVVDHIETMLQQCKRLEDVLGPQAVLHTVIAQRELVDSFLDECLDELRPRLLTVYSSMSSSIGYYLFDLDDAAGAMHYCDQARETAQEARNTELAIYALCNMSYFASWGGKAHAGIDFAAAAWSLAGKTDDILLRVCAAERAGTAYAIDGQYKEFMGRFDEAYIGLTAARAVQNVPPASPAYWYHEGLIASQQSDCLLRLGRPAEAAATAERGLLLFDSSFVGSLAFCALRLGTARLLSGEVEEAARVIGEGALLATKNRSARLVSEVSAARGRLQPWHHTPAVTTLDEQLRGMGFGA